MRECLMCVETIKRSLNITESCFMSMRLLFLDKFYDTIGGLTLRPFYLSSANPESWDSIATLNIQTWLEILYYICSSCIYGFDFHASSQRNPWKNLRDSSIQMSQVWYFELRSSEKFFLSKLRSIALWFTDALPVTSLVRIPRKLSFVHQTNRFPIRRSKLSKIWVTAGLLLLPKIALNNNRWSYTFYVFLSSCYNDFFQYLQDNSTTKYSEEFKKNKQPKHTTTHETPAKISRL